MYTIVFSISEPLISCRRRSPATPVPRQPRQVSIAEVSDSVAPYKSRFEAYGMAFVVLIPVVLDEPALTAILRRRRAGGQTQHRGAGQQPEPGSARSGEEQAGEQDEQRPARGDLTGDRQRQQHDIDGFGHLPGTAGHPAAHAT